MTTMFAGATGVSRAGLQRARLGPETFGRPAVGRCGSVGRPATTLGGRPATTLAGFLRNPPIGDKNAQTFVSWLKLVAGFGETRPHLATGRGSALPRGGRGGCCRTWVAPLLISTTAIAARRPAPLRFARRIGIRPRSLRRREAPPGPFRCLWGGSRGECRVAGRPELFL